MPLGSGLLDEELWRHSGCNVDSCQVMLMQNLECIE